MRIALPKPTRIASFIPASASIASPGNGAAQPPISVPTQSSLKVVIAFDDGSERDMTNDARVQVLVVKGADLCKVSTGRYAALNCCSLVRHLVYEAPF